MEVIVVDGLMGTGKSRWIIQKVNETKKNQRILVVVFYKTEYRRFNRATNGRLKMIEKSLNKTIECQRLVERGKDLVITHALFQILPKLVIEMMHQKGYIIIFDETPDFVSQKSVEYEDIEVLKERNMIEIDSKLNKVYWISQLEWKRYKDVKSFCESRDVYLFTEESLIAMFPFDYIKGFSQVYICTYVFNYQVIGAYCEFYQINFLKKSIVHMENGRVELGDYDEMLDNRSVIYDSIDVHQNPKHNAVGRSYYSLSKNNLKDNKSKQAQLKKSFNTYYKSINAKSKDVMWSVYVDCYEGVKGFGYTKGFVECNKKASNEFQEKSILMYGCNLFPNPFIVNFFASHGIKVCGERYAISLLVQWIWRSRIRNGEPIQLYLPSKRMRDALEKWSKYEL